MPHYLTEEQLEKWRKKPVPPKPKVIHYPGLFEGFAPIVELVKDPWNWLLLATISFGASLFYV